MAEEPLAGRFVLPADVEDHRVRSVAQVQSAALDTGRLAHVTAMARAIFGVPMAAVSLIDRDKQIFQHADGIELGASLPRENTVCQAVIARSYEPQAEPALVLDDAAADPVFSQVPGIGGEGGIRFYAGHPIYGPGGHAVGTFCLYDIEPRKLDDHDRDILGRIAAWAQRELANSDEFDRAAAVQRKLLPHPLTDLDGYTVRALCLPAMAVGGDFYDHYPVPGGVVVTVADVMGKGFGAAILAASVRSALRAATRVAAMSGEPPGLSTVMTAVAEQLDDELEDTGSFVTLFCARLHAADGVVEYIDAGHGLGMLLYTDGRVEHLRHDGLPIGVLREQAWTARQVTLAPGDTLAVVSDGALELFDPMVDIDRVVALLRDHPDPDDMCAAVRELTGSRAPLDDVTLVVIHREAG